MASAEALPTFLREGDPLLDHSCGHWYERVYYTLLWPNWPAGYSRETAPAVYLPDKEKGAYRRITDEALCKAIETHFWMEIDEQNRRMVTQPGAMQISGMMGDPGQNRMGSAGMMDGGYMTPRTPTADLPAEGWTCPLCGKAGNTSRFCPECGGKRPD